MADFVQVMKDWRRMCSAIQSKNQKTPFESWCRNCPIEKLCVIDTEIKDLTDNVFRVIDERIQSWAEENPELVYPTFREWLISIGIIGQMSTHSVIADKLTMTHIPPDIAEKLGIEPKEV